MKASRGIHSLIFSRLIVIHSFRLKPINIYELNSNLYSTSISSSILAKDEVYMKLALRQAQVAFREKEVPIGAVLVDNQGTIVSACRNAVEGLHDATCHAEIECLRAASKKLKNWRLENCTLYTTLEPCDMCMGAIMAFRVPRLVYGLNDSKIGFFRNHEYPVTSHKNAFHSIDIQGGVLSNDSKVMLKAFFQARRKTGLDSVASDDEKLLGRNLEIEK